MKLGRILVLISIGLVLIFCNTHTGETGPQKPKKPAANGKVSDLFMKDTPHDTGVEPNPSKEPMWESDDIWVRNANDGQKHHHHQNPIYGQPNFIYVRVHNHGHAASKSGTLKLYWAKSSTALGWPQPWDGSVLVPAPMGGLIGVKPTGHVAGNGSSIIEFPWLPPNPENYVAVGGNKTHFCLLARLESSPTAPFGMHSPETSDLHANVRKNKHIVWKNVHVVELGGGGTAHAHFTVAPNTFRADLPTRLGFNFLTGTGQKSLLDQGVLHAHVGDQISKQLPSTTSQKDGNPAAANKVHITAKNNHINNLKLAPNQYHAIQLEFTTHSGQLHGHDHRIRVTQYASDGKQEHVVGGMTILLRGQK